MAMTLRGTWALACQMLGRVLLLFAKKKMMKKKKMKKKMLVTATMMKMTTGPLQKPGW